MAKTSKICLANFQDICDLLDFGELRLALHDFGWCGYACIHVIERSWFDDGYFWNFAGGYGDGGCYSG